MKPPPLTTVKRWVDRQRTAQSRSGRARMLTAMIGQPDALLSSLEPVF